MTDWNVRYNGKQVGPIGSTKLKELVAQGRLSRDCEVQQEGSDKWHPITKIKGLFPAQELVSAPATVVAQREPEYVPPFVPQSPQQPIQVIVAPQPGPVVNISQTVVTHVVHGRRWSRMVAGFLSFLFPGAGQIYKGQPLNGLVWFVLTIGGYICFIIPGIVLHVLCVLGAMSGDTYR